MEIGPDDLLAGEAVLLTEHATALLPAEAEGYEAIDGSLHLTNYRLKFKSNSAAQNPTDFTIFLPIMSGLEDGLRGKLRVLLPKGKHIDFLLSDSASFMSSVNAARARAKELDLDEIWNDVLNEPTKMGDFVVAPDH